MNNVKLMRYFRDLLMLTIVIIALNKSYSQAKNDACYEHITNGDFIQKQCKPIHFHDVQCYTNWYNPTLAHPNILLNPTIIGGPQTGQNGIGVTPISPNGTNNYLGLGIATPSSGATPKVSYISTDLLFPLDPGTSYVLEFFIGSAGEGFEGGDYEGNIVLMGCNSCALPLATSSCIEQNLTILGKKTINISAGIWMSNKVSIVFTPTVLINRIVIGPGCNPWPVGDVDGIFYLLLDELCLRKNVNKSKVPSNKKSLRKFLKYPLKKTKKI